MRPLAPLLLSCAVLLGGCGSPTGVNPRFEFGEAFSLREGAVAVSSDGTTVVEFLEVVTDSRCPGGPIVCIWAGEAIVALSVHGAYDMIGFSRAEGSAKREPADAVGVAAGADLSIAVPRFEVKVGAPEPTQAGAWVVEVVALDQQQNPSASRPRYARIVVRRAPSVD